MEKELHNLQMSFFHNEMKKIIFVISFIGLTIIEVLSFPKFRILFGILSCIGTWLLIIAILYSDYKFKKIYEKLKIQYNKKLNSYEKKTIK